MFTRPFTNDVILDVNLLFQDVPLPFLVSVPNPDELSVTELLHLSRNSPNTPDILLRYLSITSLWRFLNSSKSVSVGVLSGSPVSSPDDFPDLLFLSLIELSVPLSIIFASLLALSASSLAIFVCLSTSFLFHMIW